MATVYSRFGATNAPKVGLGWGGTAKTVWDTYALTTTQLNSTSTIVQMCWVPKNARILDLKLVCDDMDSSTGLAFNVGDSGSATRFISASAVGQTATSATIAITAIGYKFTADTAILVAVQAAATTAVAGNIYLFVTYVMDETA